MSNWDDCLELLRDGQSCTGALPAVRALLESLPPPSTQSKPDTYNLTTEIHGYKLKMPYLRPPPNLWQEFEPQKDVYDDELKFDVLSMFKARMLEPLVQTGKNEVAAVDLEEGQLSIEEEGITQRRKKVNTAQVAAKLSGNECIEDSLTEDEWALVVCDCDINWSFSRAMSALRRVNQESFSRVMLYSVIPMCGFSGEETGRLVELAASLGSIQRLKAEELGQLVEIYRAIEGGAGAQTALVRWYCGYQR